ncbi:MAG: DEAD/DEAH box helicase [Cyanobacteria bacterium SZAS-4]|nr:DEAD/DEAH box helicase [Cyanobacteria bacterium SZAS-4]
MNLNYPLVVSGAGEVLRTKVMVLSPKHGVLILIPAELIDQSPASAIEDVVENVEAVMGEVMAKLVKNKATRIYQSSVHCAIYAPHLHRDVSEYTSYSVLRTNADILRYINEHETLDLSSVEFAQLQSVIEMSNVLKQPKRRSLANENSKGSIAARTEFEIATFDRNQVEVFLSEITGLERIKGLAGSGKTVVLAVKAAIIHAFYPEKKLAFTYYTRSLHQHITKLITEFHQSLADKEPNWDNMQVMHAWGGKTAGKGFYSEVCRAHAIPAIKYSQVKQLAEPFDYVCKQALRVENLNPMFDYVFVDEGQDFPSSFLKLASKVTKEHKLVWAYDALQNIFNVKAPRAEDIFDDISVEDIDDQSLKKCYRNSAEILVTAHALGFGIYGKIVQMLENQEYWEDLGYEIESGELTPGSEVVITRPADNSLRSMSLAFDKHHLVIARAFNSLQEEVSYVVGSIKNDIQQDELRADDIMVISVDNRAAAAYLDGIESGLANLGIGVRNLRTDPAGGKQFFEQRHVTLSSVNRAKGNEGYMVYVVGTDALFQPQPDPISRNALFTAITRAKGWVRVTGLGDANCKWKTEIDMALLHAPKMKFRYPTKEELVVMERELQKGRKREKQREKFEKFLDKLSDEELEDYLAQRKYAKKKLQEFTDSLADKFRSRASQSNVSDFFEPDED